MLGRLRDRLLARRWKPMLRRLQVELAREGRANRQMLQTYARWMDGRASDDQMRQAEQQMRELLKTVGVGGLAILPFSPITIPWLVAMGNRVGIQILPDWYFRLVSRKSPTGKAIQAANTAPNPAKKPQ